jgi:hypothetical protein
MQVSSKGVRAKGKHDHIQVLKLKHAMAHVHIPEEQRRRHI